MLEPHRARSHNRRSRRAVSALIIETLISPRGRSVADETPQVIGGGPVHGSMGRMITSQCCRQGVETSKIGGGVALWDRQDKVAKLRQSHSDTHTLMQAAGEVGQHKLTRDRMFQCFQAKVSDKIKALVKHNQGKVTEPCTEPCTVQCTVQCTAQCTYVCMCSLRRVICSPRVPCPTAAPGPWPSTASHRLWP